MWGLFVGIVIGVLQVLGLRVFGKMLIGESIAAKALAMVLIFIKIALIVFVIILISNVSIAHVIWTAGGMLLGLIATLVFFNMRKPK